MFIINIMKIWKMGPKREDVIKLKYKMDNPYTDKFIDTLNQVNDLH